MVSILDRLKRNRNNSDASSSESSLPHYLSSLNEEQLEAVTETEGYIRVVAGAGSGKTKALTSRVMYLIDSIGIAPENILCVTFTNKAANEMKKRVLDGIGDLSSGALIMTFGSLEARIIREDGNVIGYPKNYQIIDEEDSKRLLSEILKQTKEEFAEQFVIDPNIKVRLLKKTYDESLILPPTMTWSLPELSGMIESTRTALVSNGYQKDTVINYILRRYCYEKRKSFACDFHDLPFLCIMVLERSKNALEKWQEKLKYIMVDEFQDVSKPEYYILKLLQEKYKNLFIVGDPDQTIYTFRGSNIEYFLNFDTDYQPTKTILLTKNYRSGSKILEASNTLIKNNTGRIDKDLTAMDGGPGGVTYYHAKTIYEEADFVVHNVRNFMNNGTIGSDIAILYRSHHVSRAIEEKLLKANIAYKVYSGIGFYQRKEIKDILAYMRLLIDGDDISFTRVCNEPRRQLGPQTLTKIKNLAKQKGISMVDSFLELSNTNDPHFVYPKKQDFAEFIRHFRANRITILSVEQPLSDLMSYILEKTEYEEVMRANGEEERLDNLSEFKQSLIDHEKSLEGEPSLIEDYLQNITLLTSQDADTKLDRVKLMTVHAAKGLEFPVVFVVSLNEGIFPSSKIRKPSEMEEERRLAYVAYTRAKKHLIVSDAEGNNFDGGTRYPSRFIFDTGDRNLDYLVELDDELKNSYGNYPELVEDSEYIQLAVNDRVSHDSLGDGTVMSMDGDYAVVRFDNKVNELKIKLDKLKPISSSK